MEEDKKIPMWIRDEDKTYENENVNAPQHYLHGKKETIDVIKSIEIEKSGLVELIDLAEEESDKDFIDLYIDAEIGDEEMPAEGEEDVLRAIYDLLAAHFEGSEEEMGDEELPVDDMGGEEPELEENASTEAAVQKTGHKPFGKKSAGANAGYGAVGGKGSTGYDAGSKALQERFQKLANIIK